MTYQIINDNTHRVMAESSRKADAKQVARALSKHTSGTYEVLDVEEQSRETYGLNPPPRPPIPVAKYTDGIKVAFEHAVSEEDVSR